MRRKPWKQQSQLNYPEREKHFEIANGKVAILKCDRYRGKFSSRRLGQRKTSEHLSLSLVFHTPYIQLRMADDTTKLVFQLAEGICQDIDTLREDIRCAEESYRATTKSIHAVKDAVRIAEESQCNWEASMKRMNETFVSLQKSTQDMGESCRNWQESIQTNYDNTNILNKRMQSIVSSRQSSCSRTLRLSADIDRRSHAESPFGGHPNSWTPTPSQRMVTESSHSLRTESPLSALSDIRKTPKPPSIRMNSDKPPHAELPPSRVSTRSSATKPSSKAKDRLESLNPAVILQTGTCSSDAHVQTSPTQHKKDKQKGGNPATPTPTVESVPGGEDEARTSRAKPAANKDDVRGNVCLACLQSWEKSLNENTGRLKEGCVYNPGATDCSECIEKQRKGPQECRKVSIMN